MADFKQAFEFMMEHEDPGKTGVIVWDNNQYKVRYGLNAKFNPDLPDGFYTDMPNAQAILIAEQRYKENYWNPIKGDFIDSQDVASKVLDLAVNAGPRQAVKLLQRAIGLPTLEVDGKIGLNTLTVLNSKASDEVLQNLVQQWNWFIDQEIQNKPQDFKYAKVWRKRASDLPEDKSEETV